jgi:hypothetical protein
LLNSLAFEDAPVVLQVVAVVPIYGTGGGRIDIRSESDPIVNASA